MMLGTRVALTPKGVESKVIYYYLLGRGAVNFHSTFEKNHGMEFS